MKLSATLLALIVGTTFAGCKPRPLRPVEKGTQVAAEDLKKDETKPKTDDGGVKIIPDDNTNPGEPSMPVVGEPVMVPNKPGENEVDLSKLVGLKSVATDKCVSSSGDLVACTAFGTTEIKATKADGILNLNFPTMAKCLEHFQSNTNDGSEIKGSACVAGTAPQKWKIKEADGSFTLESSAVAGKCAQANTDTTGKLKIQTAPCSMDAKQKFKLIGLAAFDAPVKAPEEYSGLKSLKTNLCVDGSGLWDYECIDRPDFTVKLVYLAADTVKLKHNNGRCLSILKWTDVADLYLAGSNPCDKYSGEDWKIKAVEGGFTLENLTLAGKCITARGEDEDPYNLQHRYKFEACASSPEQKFTFVKPAPDTGKIRNFGQDTAAATIELKAAPNLPPEVVKTYAKYGAKETPNIVPYYSGALDAARMDWITPKLEQIWNLWKKEFPDFNTQRLYFFYSEIEALKNTISTNGGYSYDPKFGYRNAVSIQSGKVLSTENGVGLDLLCERLSYTISRSLLGGFKAPGIFKFDFSFAEIFVYDTYATLGWKDHADRFYATVKDQKEFKNLWFPLYKDHGGHDVFVRYFKLVKANIPLNSSHFYSRDFNLGEYALFLSEAAKADVRPLMKAAMTWTADNDKEWEQARKDFPVLKNF